MVMEKAEAAMRDDNIGPWILGGAMALLSLFGLFLAGAAQDSVFYGTGLALFVFGILFIFGLIHRYVGRQAAVGLKAAVMAEDFDLKYVGIVAAIIGAAVLSIGLVGLTRLLLA
jgi:hypothetical protein